MCLDDVTDDDLPESYKRVQSFFGAAELNSNQILAIALYIMAVESGFNSDVEDDVLMNERCFSFDLRRIMRISPEFVTGRLNEDKEYTFPLYIGSSKKVVLRIQSLCGKFLVYLFNPDSLICFSKILDVSSYVTREAQLNKSKLKQLSQICKDDLFYPMKSFCLSELGVRHACLLDLPAEILELVVKYVDVKDFLHLCASCRHLFNSFRESDNILNYYQKKFGKCYRRCEPPKSMKRNYFRMCK